MVLGGNWLLGLIINDAMVRAMILTLLICMIGKPQSGSVICRETIIGLPGTFFVVVAFTVLGFWVAAGLAFVLICYRVVFLGLDKP